MPCTELLTHMPATDPTWLFKLSQCRQNLKFHAAVMPATFLMLNSHAIRGGGSMGKCWHETFPSTDVFLVLPVPWILLQATLSSFCPEHQSVAIIQLLQSMPSPWSNLCPRPSRFPGPFTWACSPALLRPGDRTLASRLFLHVSSHPGS